MQGGLRLWAKPEEDAVRPHNVHRLAFVGLIVYQLALAVQGLDLTDEGFWASFYQSIFVDPDSVRYGFMYWLTGVVGGAWHKLFAGWGLLGLRILGVLVQSLTFLMAAYVVKPFVRPGALAVGLSVSMLLIHGSVLSLFGNVFSAFLLMASVACFWRFLRGGRSVWLVAAGWVVGISPFARLPNVMALASLTIPLMHLYASGGWRWREAARIAAATLAGFGLGVLSALGLMVALGHGAVFLRALQLVGQMGADSGEFGHHSFGALIGYQIRLYVTALVVAAACVAMWAAGRFGLRLTAGWLPGRVHRALAWMMAVVLSGCLAYVAVRLPALRMAHYLALALGLLAAGCSLWRRRRDPLQVTVWWSAILVVFVLPLGSDVPQSVMKYAFVMLLPLTVNTVFPTAEEVEPACGTLWRRALCVAGGTAYALALAVLVWRSPYRDGPQRLRLRASVSGTRVAGILTTPARAAEISALVQALTPHLRPGDKLLAYADMPMIHYLTDTRPFLYNAWPKTYAPAAFARALDEAKQEAVSLPVVLRQHFNVGVRGWPEVRTPYLEASANLMRTQYLDAFLTQNGYVCVWENENFDLWKTDYQ